MSARASRRARLWILVTGVVAVGLGIGALVAFRRVRSDRIAESHRDAGRAAFAAGDYPAAIEGLGRWLQRAGDGAATADDWISYARARARTPEPGGAHLQGAIAAYRRALEIPPASDEVRRELLDIYGKVGFRAEALDLADALLVAHPGDAQALLARTEILEDVKRYPQAIEASTQLNEAEGFTFAGLVRTLRLHLRAESPPRDVDAWIASLETRRPDDVRFAALRAAHQSFRSGPDAGRAVLDRAVAACGMVEEPAYLVFVAAELDRAGRRGESIDVLGRLHGRGDAFVDRELARRLWYAGRREELLARTATIATPAGAAGPEPEVMVLRGLALLAAGRRADAEAVARDLAPRSDAPAPAWRTVLADALDPAALPAGERMKALLAASASAPESAVMHLATGDACAAAGETDRALEAWKLASDLAPAWPRPLCRTSDALRRTARPVLALGAAQAARARGGADPESARVLLLAEAALSGAMEPDRRAQLLRELDAAVAADPATAAEFVPVRIGLVAATDRERATQMVRDAIAADPVPDESALLSLAQAAYSIDPALAGEVLARCESAHGPTARLALTAAAAAVPARGADAGLAAFDAMRAKSGAAADDVRWAEARAAFLDFARLPEAGTAWRELAVRRPDDLSLQLGALSCEAAWGDRAEIARVIERVRALTDEAGVTWRTARARWLMSAPEAPADQVAEAIALLRRVVQEASNNVVARLLLAQALERSGDVSGAESQVQDATALAPENPWLAIELARFAQLRGDRDAARRHLERVLRARNLAPEQIERAAYLLAVQGETRRGVELLSPLDDAEKAGRDGTFLLATLLHRLGEYDRALQLCDRLLQQPSAPAVELAADSLMALGRRGDAERVLGTLDRLDLRPGDRELLRARWCERWDVSGADEAFRAAVAADPSRGDVWRAYLAHAIDVGDAAAFTAIADDPRTATFEGIRFLATNRAVVLAALGDPRLRPCIGAAVEDPGTRPALLDAVRLVTSGWDDPKKRAEIARSVRGFAAANVRSVPLQLLAADLSGAAGDVREAASIAQRTMREFPGSAVAARTAVEWLGRNSKWDDALVAAREWRSRTGGRDVRSDVALAGVLLRLDRAAEAAAALEPHVAAARSGPELRRDVLLSYAVALARSGRVPAATDLLRDLAAVSTAWRTLPLDVGPAWLRDGAGAAAWLRICASMVPAEDAAARTRLAGAWAAAWEVHRSDELLAEARALLAELTTGPGATPDAHCVAAMLHQQTGDAAAARRSYEAALSLAPKMPVARNNLAMVLADGGDAAAAAEHARVLVAAHPDVAEFRDTLAYALRRAGKLDEARAEIERAAALEPWNLKWAVSSAELLAESGDAKELARVLARIDERITAGAVPEPDVAARLARLRGKSR